ncbi:MAG: FHA domain-containing protein [Proteobacteria bacterium]|nr:FHA domain-containing protein [Pseudomonadota bacterium]
MASEPSDLTFVRCPSCRSLVPASAARCRICNNPLDSLAQSEGGGEAAKGTGRIRQRTVTAAPQDVISAVVAAKTEKALAVSAAPSVQGDDEFDPLGAYLQDLEGVDEVVATAPEALQPDRTAPAQRAEDDDDDEEDDPFDLDLFDEPVVEKPTSAAPEQRPVKQPAVNDPFDDEITIDPVAPKAVVAKEREAEVRPHTPMPAAPRREEQRPRGVEAQQGGGQQRGGGEARKNEARPPQRSEPQRSERMQEQRQNRPAPTQQRAPEPPRAPEPQRPKRDERDERRQDHNRPAQQQPPEQRHEQRHEQGRRAGDPQQHATVSERTQASTGPKTGKMRPGKLFGWLVSYESPDGRAIELREGKFFVTASSIKGTDLILEDPSISTPHALMSISEGGFLVQDLMSDHGVFVRHDERAEYQQEESLVRVSHGDWLRFGEVEFLVIIVPASSSR